MNHLLHLLLFASIAVPSGQLANEIDSPPNQSAGAARGELLARIHCQRCHIFPEPRLLDKESWIKGALPRMAPFLGAAKINFDKRPDGKTLKDSSLFPSEPLISEADWRAINHFYYENGRDPRRQTQRTVESNLSLFEPRPIRYSGSAHLVSLLRTDPGKSRIFIGNAARPSLDVVALSGELISRIDVESPPVDIAVRPEGIYLILIGNLFPSDERKGKLVLVEGAGTGRPRMRTLIDQLARPTSAQFAEFNGDGLEDILLCSFGNYLGGLSWFEKDSTGGYREHLLLDRSGAVNTVFISNPKSDVSEFVVLMAQGREGLYRFRKMPGGKFESQAIAEFHPAFGASNLSLADFNHDGHPDLLLTNGDNGDYPSRPKDYHGLRIFMNDGRGEFSEKWFYPLNGAFKAAARDFDLDGDLDMAAISFFPDYQKSPEESFLYLENSGALNFSATSFHGGVSGRWLTMDADDIDGDGDDDIVLGSFAEGPRSIPIPAQLQAAWRTNGFSVLFLENKSRNRKP